MLHIRGVLQIRMVTTFSYSISDKILTVLCRGAIAHHGKRAGVRDDEYAVNLVQPLLSRKCYEQRLVVSVSKVPMILGQI